MSAGIFHNTWRPFWPLLLISILLIVVSISAFWFIRQSEARAEEALESSLGAHRAYLALEKTTEELRHQLALYAATGDQERREQIQKLHEQSSERLIIVGKWTITEDERGFVSKLQRSIGVIQSGMQRMGAAPAERQEAVQRLISESLDPATMSKMREHCQHRQDALEQAHLANQTSHAGWWLLLLGTLGSLGGLLGGYSLAKRYQHELQELSVPIHNAAGSLSTIVGPLRLSRTSSVPELEASLKGLATQVESVVERLQTAERAKVRSEQLAALGQLAAGLAHELRNPLTSIQTLIESAKSQPNGKSLDAQDLNVIEEEVTRLNRTLQAFLDYARPPAMQKSPSDLNELTRKCIQLVSAQAQQREIGIDLVAGKEPLIIVCDAEKIRQVVLNLMLNAFDAIGTHGTVTVEVSQRDGQGVIQVKDTGPGIAASLRDRLFEPFVTSRAAGTGLGLTICQRIMEEHGGSISGENLPDRGACFTVKLPS